MTRRALLTALLLVAASALVVMTASALSQYDLGWWTVDGGGGSFSTNGGYGLAGTIGQPDAGPPMNGGGYSLLGGFLAELSAGPTPPGSVNISGNAGPSGATLSYDDGGPQTVTADNNGHYIITVPLHWSGTVTPTKSNFTFVPDHIDYVDLTVDQPNQDYAAHPQAPAIFRFFPPDGATVCLTPQVGVRLGLADLVRTGNGSFDPSTVTLKLDTIDRTGTARISQSLSLPAVQATILYIPTGNLSAGQHTAAFTYPSPGGPITEQWTFTAANMQCSQ